MATGSYMTPIYSRSQSQVQGDLHNLDDVANTVLLEKPTERNSTVIAVQPTADRVKDDHVCMEHVKAEEPSISTFF
ncbi:hypothetical protein TNCV_3480371 [Trichonephila clavipes]|nr:hypothetical protein TNCV_3480371 [Trichonephila clavipes]